MANTSIEVYDLNYGVVLRDYMRYLQGFGFESSQDEVRNSEDFKRIVAVMRGRHINTIPYTTWGQSLSRYYNGKYEREMEQMEEVAKIDALKLREEPEPATEEM